MFRHYRRWISPIVIIVSLAMTLVVRPVSPTYASPSSEVEPNNTLFQAQMLTSIGMYSSISGNIDTPQDVDVYAFEAVQNRTYVIELFNVANSLADTGYRCTDPGMNFGEKGLGLFIYNPAQAQMTGVGGCDAASHSTGNVHHRENFTAGSSGTFYIKVLSNSYTATGFYSLRILPSYNEPGGSQWDVSYEPNNSIRTAYPITPGYANALTSDIAMRNPNYATYSADYDWYRFDAVAKNTYVIELFNVAQALGAEGMTCSAPWAGNDRGLFMIVLNPSAVEVARQCNANDQTHSAGNVHHSMEFIASDSGTYYILVRPNVDTVSGFYSIRVLPKYDQPGADWDPVSFEPNNAIWNSYPIKPGVDNWLTSQIDLRDPIYSTFFADQDWYRIDNAFAGQTYEIELFNVIGTLGVSTCINVYDSARSQLAGNCARGPTGLNTINHRVQFVPSLTGTYHINIAPGDQNAVGSYSLLVCEDSCPDTAPPPPKSPTWLTLLYLAGDNNASGSSSSISLATEMRGLLSRLQGMTYNPDMRLVVLFDGDKAGGGDTRIYTRDQSGLVDITEQAANSPYWLGGMNGSVGAHELDTGDPATLSTFVTWARKTYPGARYSMLSIVDHGGGWASDIDAPGQPRNMRRVQSGGWRGLNLDLTTPGGSSLATRNLGQALHDAGHIDVLFIDACLMSMIENAYEVRDYADYMLASENLLFAELPYQDYLAKNGLTSSATPLDLVKRLVARYNVGTTSQLNPFTISALDLRQLRSAVSGNLAVQLNILAGRLIAALPTIPTNDTPLVQALKQIYTETQKFDYDSSLTLDPREGYVDLVDFAARIRDTSLTIPSDIKAAAGDVVNAAMGATPVIIANRMQSGSYEGTLWNLSGAKGLSIFLPLGEQDYRPTKADPSDPTKPFLPDHQLTYYADPTQLMLTHDAPKWAELLVLLEPTVPIIRTGSSSQPTVVSLAASPIIDNRPFHASSQEIFGYTTSGTIRTISGVGVAGVTVLLGAGITATTIPDGSYTISGLSAGNYTLTPSLSGFTFSPPSITINLQSDISGQNFTVPNPPQYHDYLPLILH